MAVATDDPGMIRAEPPDGHGARLVAAPPCQLAAPLQGRRSHEAPREPTGTDHPPPG